MCIWMDKDHHQSSSFCSGTTIETCRSIHFSVSRAAQHPLCSSSQGATSKHTYTTTTSPPLSAPRLVTCSPSPWLASSTVWLADVRGRGWWWLDGRWSGTLLFNASALSRKRPVSESQRTKVMMMMWEKRYGMRVQRDGEVAHLYLIKRLSVYEIMTSITGFKLSEEADSDVGSSADKLWLQGEIQFITYGAC